MVAISKNIGHVPVLIEEICGILKQLVFNPIICDATFGNGGYTAKFLEFGRVICIDRDPRAVERARLINHPNMLHVLHSNVFCLI
jgi:16S rRNA C1402 N4-methylase RsmH